MNKNFLFSVSRIRFPSFFLILLLFIFSINFISADFGFNDPTLPNIPKPEQTFITFDNNTGSVNDTLLWQGYTPQSYNSTFISWIPSWVSDLFVPYTGATKDVNIGANDFLLGGTINSTLEANQPYSFYIDGRKNNFTDDETRYMRGIYSYRSRGGLDNINVGSSASAYINNEGVYTRTDQTGNVNFSVKPQTFGLFSSGLVNELYHTYNHNATTQFGSTDTQFGITNTLSKTGMWQPADDFAIGSTVTQYGIYNSVISSLNIGQTKQTLNMYGLYNTVSGSMTLGANNNFILRSYGSYNSAGVSTGTSNGVTIERYGSYNLASQQYGTSYGSYNSAQSQSATNYGVFASATNGIDNWAFFNGQGNNSLGDDYERTYWGTGKDASLFFNGTSMVYKANENGTNTHFFISPVYMENLDVLGVFNLSYDKIYSKKNLASEVLTNGNFTGSAANWTLTSGWTYSTNTLRHSANGQTNASQLSINMTTPLKANTTYELGFTVSTWTAGSVIPYVGGKAGTTRIANGRYVEVIKSNDATGLVFSPSNTARFYLDDITLKELSVDLIVDANTNLNGNVNISGNVHIDGNVSIKRPYGMFSSTETQTIALADTAYPITFNWTEDNYLISIEGKENFSMTQSGDYKVDLSAILNTDTNNKHVEIWSQIWNGTAWNNVPRSNTRITIENAGMDTLIAVPFIIDLLPTEKFRLMWASDDAGSNMQYYTNTSYSPETPSIIMTIHKVSEIPSM